MTPTWRPHARGTLHGLTAAHDRRHIARAVLEERRVRVSRCRRRLAAPLGLPTADVLLVGGSAASATWAQLRADALARPHRVAHYTDTAALGAALLAAVAAGAAPDASSTAAAPLAARMQTTTFAPVPANVAALEAAYRRYQRLVGQLAPLALAPW